jgi:hypothetical protein
MPRQPQRRGGPPQLGEDRRDGGLIAQPYGQAVIGQAFGPPMQLGNAIGDAEIRYQPQDQPQGELYVRIKPPKKKQPRVIKALPNGRQRNIRLKDIMEEYNKHVLNDERYYDIIDFRAPEVGEIYLTTALSLQRASRRFKESVKRLICGKMERPKEDELDGYLVVDEPAARPVGARWNFQR